MTRSTALTLAAALVLGTPLLSACGDEDKVKERAEQSLRALGSYDGGTYCSLKLNESNTAPLKNDATALQDCVDGLAMVAMGDPEKKMTDLKNATVAKVDVGGDMAVISTNDIQNISDEAKKAIANPDGSPGQIKLKKVDGDWYLFTQEDDPATRPNG